MTDYKPMDEARTYDYGHDGGVQVICPECEAGIRLETIFRAGDAQGEFHRGGCDTRIELGYRISNGDA